MNNDRRGHGLMQAIARVNRVFRDKSGGLVVDYIGIGQKRLPPDLAPVAVSTVLSQAETLLKWGMAESR